MVVLAKISARMSVDEFLNWDSGDALRYELVDGEPRAMAPALPDPRYSAGPVGDADQQSPGSRKSPMQFGRRARRRPASVVRLQCACAGVGGDLRTLSDRRSGAAPPGPAAR